MTQALGNLLRRLADNRRPGSMADRFRRRRFALFQSLLQGVQASGEGRVLRILDVGGTPSFWERMGFAASPEVEIVLLNLEHQEVPNEHMRSLIGNATDLSMFEGNGFDIVISNSVIEHLPDLELQRKMASEIQRVGVRHWVQTPNRRFPLEPHFLFPFFQYLPLAARSWLLAHMDLGWFPRERDRDAARATVRSVRLMTKRELRDLFPNSRVLSERAFGLVKSYIVIGGWQETEGGSGSGSVRGMNSDRASK